MESNTNLPLRPPAEVHGFPKPGPYTRGVQAFYAGRLDNPHSEGSNDYKEYERGQNYAYAYTLRVQRSIERSIRAKRNKVRARS